MGEKLGVWNYADQMELISQSHQCKGLSVWWHTFQLLVETGYQKHIR